MSAFAAAAVDFAHSRARVAMAREDLVVKAKRSFGASRRRRIEASVRSFASALGNWLLRVARREARLARARLLSRGPRALIHKDDPWHADELELAALLERYGLRQYGDAARSAASSAGGSWVWRPTVRDDLLEQVASRVKLLVASTRSEIQASLRTIVGEALSEEPRPSTQEIARRIARQWHGPAEARESLFSPERATLIARTELAQVENAGIARGLADSGVEEVERLAYSDGLSGDRHHERMDGKTISVEAMNGDDESKWFLTPLGNRMPWPAWIGAPVGDTANCRCMVVPA